ncbi:MAG TPA: UbiA-like polyprenyltransferase [Syntrophobacteria bacterium]|nr:UbiA-like polyprenyltransferase [Syntrophobacteria bacterium]
MTVLSPSQLISALATRMQLFGRMIRFSHTVFALPFALGAVVLAQRIRPLTPWLLFWILVAMAGARSAAMGFNRIADMHIDRTNPRTAGRELPTGVISLQAALTFVGISSLVFVLAAAMISRLCLFLSFPVLAILFLYSYTKRFTVLSHLYLGFGISLAPVGAWIAVTGRFEPAVMILSLALLTYIAGFDILYACQDLEFDRKTGLCSIPARLGPVAAFHISAGLHGITFLSLLLVLRVFDLGVVYLLATLIMGALLIVEHRLVRPNDLTRIEAAFFHVNSAISVILFLGILGDELVRHWL